MTLYWIAGILFTINRSTKDQYDYTLYIATITDHLIKPIYENLKEKFYHGRILLLEDIFMLLMFGLYNIYYFLTKYCSKFILNTSDSGVARMLSSRSEEPGFKP